jgi:outer membrane protein
LKRTLLALLILATAAQASFAQTRTAKWTLEECLKYAMDNNISVKQADLNKRISQNTKLQSMLNVLPNVSASGSYSFNFGNSINPTTYTYSQSNSQSFSPSLNGSLALFEGLQQINNYNKNKYDVLASTWDLANVQNNTALNVTNLFLQLVLNKELVKAAEKQVDISQSQLDVMKAKIKAGTMAEASIYDFEAQLARDKATLTTQKNSELISLITLKIALQVPDQENFDVVVPDVKVAEVLNYEKMNPQDIFDFAVNNQPSVKSAEAKTKSSLYTVKYYKGALSPTLSMNFSLRSNYFDQSTKISGVTPYLLDQGTPIFSDNSASPSIVGYDRLAYKYSEVKTPFTEQLKNNFSKVVSFNLNVPLFSGWLKMTNIANSKLQYQIQQLNLESTKNTLKKDIYQSFANAKGYAESYLANKIALEAQQQAYKVTEKKFNAGISTDFELQQSRSNLAKSESNAIQAKYNYIFSTKVLDFYQGKPITLN